MYRCIACGEWFDSFDHDNRLSVLKGQSYCDMCASLSTTVEQRAFDRILQSYIVRAEKVGVVSDFTLDDLVYMRDWFGGVCAYCGSDFTLLEHVIPQSAGGGLTAANIVPACVWCNRAKQHSPVSDFLLWLYRGDTALVQNRLNDIQRYFESVNKKIQS